MTEYYTEGGFHFSVENNFINVGPLLGDAKRDKNFVIVHEDDDDDDVKVAKTVLPLGPVTINDDEENDEVDVDDIDENDDDDDGNEEELLINDVILVGEDGDDDWSKDSYSRKCADDAEYDSIEEEEQILRKYTADQNKTNIRSHDSVGNSKSSRSILLPRHSPSKAASLIKNKVDTDSSRPRDADRSFSVLRQWLNNQSSPQRRWIDSQAAASAAASCNPDSQTHNLHLRDRSKIRRQLRVDEEQEMREELEKEIQRMKKLKREEEEKSRLAPDAVIVDIEKILSPESVQLKIAAAPVAKKIRNNNKRRRPRKQSPIRSGWERSLLHNELEQDRRRELRRLFENLHEIILETAATNQLAELADCRINLKVKVHILRHAKIAIKALEQKRVILEARQQVLKRQNKKLTAKLHTLQPKLHTLQPKLHTLQPKLHTLQPKLHTLQPKLHTLQPKLHTLQPKLHTLQPKLDTLQPKLHTLQPKLHTLQPKLHTLQPEVEQDEDDADYDDSGYVVIVEKAKEKEEEKEVTMRRNEKKLRSGNGKKKNYRWNRVKKGKIIGVKVIGISENNGRFKK